VFEVRVRSHYLSHCGEPHLAVLPQQVLPVASREQEGPPLFVEDVPFLKIMPEPVPINLFTLCPHSGHVFTGVSVMF